MVCVSFVQGEIYAELGFFSSFWWAGLSEVVILSADDWVCIFVLFVVWIGFLHRVLQVAG